MERPSGKPDSTQVPDVVTSDSPISLDDQAIRTRPPIIIIDLRGEGVELKANDPRGLRQAKTPSFNINSNDGF